MRLPVDIALDTLNNQALVVGGDYQEGDVMAVDLNGQSVGDRESLTKSIIAPGGVVVYGNKALVVDSDYGRLSAVEVSGGARGSWSVISGYNGSVQVGSGPALSYPVGVAVDADNNQALVADYDGQNVIAVDLANGTRTVLSGMDPATGMEVGVGPSLGAPQGIETATDRALVVGANSAAKNLIEVDLSQGATHGARTVLSGDDPDTGLMIGSGPEFVFPNDIALDTGNNVGLVLDSGLNSVVAVELGSGERAILSQ
jgi:DNA-binding beta-propeller fold protein YncE